MANDKKKNIHEGMINQLRNQKKKLEEKKGSLARELHSMDGEIEKIVNAISALK